MAKRVVLAMSGGVDSSASAYLLKEQGYEVIGLFMRSGAFEESVCAASSLPQVESPSGRRAAESESNAAFPPPSGPSRLPIAAAGAHKQGCCSAADAADARRVADQLGIPFHALNFQDAFRQIKDYFADEYLAGRTPNPCVMCNNWLKFGRLWDFARQVEADYIATGHYARIVPAAPVPSPGERAGKQSQAPEAAALAASSAPLASRGPALICGRDLAKDQSYVLFGIQRELLERIIFPVGDFEKPEIRRIAAEAGLRVADKPDSQEICFIPSGDYARFIERYRGKQQTAGELVDTNGNVVGRHNGYENFTIGQRRGLGVTFGAPRYVVAIQPQTRRVVIGTKDDLSRRQLEADRLNWLVENVPARFRCQAKIRYRHQPAAAEAHVLAEDRLRVVFDEPQYGVAPGQAVVLYDGPRVLGGGWIR